MTKTKKKIILLQIKTLFREGFITINTFHSIPKFHLLGTRRQL